ncbi:hypothetical protein PENTCL1PPCAC_13204 [Pristionchus entomophagus]|uniref:BZIP domain-containing protein n=1 Tax=Pristionchus entomophagus TaxID=358040 RepID=A0AAV5TDY6_9BILA|nr:hypothetical protein PENTCL1PPCAC_13204 [Pristionchus entomophagus]
MVWPAMDSSLYDFNTDLATAWDGAPIPIDDLDHVFDPANYPSPPLPLPQQQQLQYPTPEQTQVWSREEQATMDRLFEDAIGEPFDPDGFDLDELDRLLGDEHEQQMAIPLEEDPLAEFFPMLGSTSSSTMAPTLAITPPQPHLDYHEMGLSTLSYQSATTMTTTTHQLSYGTEGTSGYDDEAGWVRMGAADGRIDRSPTFADTGCDLNVYLNDWYDEPSTSRSSPDDYYQQPSRTPSGEGSTMTSSAAIMTTSVSRRQTARHQPYARRTPAPAPAKRAPVFRPEGFGTPAIGENVDEYRKRRDKNNVSSARSRAKKAESLKEMKAEAVQLEKKNIELKAVMDSLEREVSYYKELMMTALAK